MKSVVYGELRRGEVSRLRYPEGNPFGGFKALYPLDTFGWNSNDVTLRDLILEMRPRFAVEVGTWKGASALWIAGAMVRAACGEPCELVCVDTWLGALEFLPGAEYVPGEERDLAEVNGHSTVYQRFLSNVWRSGMAGVITPFPATSLCGAAWFKREGLRPELIYVDGSHEYPDVKADLAAWTEVLAPGGMICGDDWCGWEGVRMAVLEAFSGRARDEWQLRSHCEFWWAVRRDA